MTGTASVWQHGVLLETVGPGSFFGEISLLAPGEQTATVVSETDMRLLVLTRSEFTSTSFFIPTVMERMLVVMSERFRRADKAWAWHIKTAGRAEREWGTGRKPRLVATSATSATSTTSATCGPSAFDAAFDPVVG